MKVKCHGDEVTITTDDLIQYFDDLIRVRYEGDWSDRGECVRAKIDEIRRRIKKNGL